MDIIYGFTIAMVFYILFSILFIGLNKSMLKVFEPLQKLTRKLKRKRIYEMITLVIFIFIGIQIKNIFKSNTIEFSIIVGFVCALKDIIFENTIEGGKKNKRYS